MKDFVITNHVENGVTKWQIAKRDVWIKLSKLNRSTALYKGNTEIRDKILILNIGIIKKRGGGLSRRHKQWPEENTAQRTVTENSRF